MSICGVETIAHPKYASSQCEVSLTVVVDFVVMEKLNIIDLVNYTIISTSYIHTYRSICTAPNLEGFCTMLKMCGMPNFDFSHPRTSDVGVYVQKSLFFICDWSGCRRGERR